MSERERIVITGIGVVSPLGNSVAAFWDGLKAGRSGVRPIERWDTTDLTSRIAGQAEDVVPEGMGPKDLRRRDRCILFALEACDQAMASSGLDMSREDPHRCGIVLGTGIGGMETIDEQHTVLMEKGPRRVSPMMVPKVICNMGSGEAAIRHNLMGPNRSVVTACAAGAQSIADAGSIILLGQADVMVAGGTEAAINRFGMAGFCSMKAMSTRNDEPERASRPFDADRDGFVMGEGAGVVVLERESHARARGAEILGELAGWGESCDAHHITSPRPDGSGQARAMRSALDHAGLEPGQIDYFNPHGTSTKYNEIAEAAALRMVYGEDMPLVSSTKSMTGHLIGAAGAVEAIASLMAIRDGVVPPNINFDTPDPECRVNLVANEAREADIAAAMSNSLGFGGHNASLILGRYV